MGALCSCIEKFSSLYCGETRKRSWQMRRDKGPATEVSRTQKKVRRVNESPSSINQLRSKKSHPSRIKKRKRPTTELVALYSQILGGASLVEKSPGLSQKVCQEASRRATRD
jgi:hypothetical protein